MEEKINEQYESLLKDNAHLQEHNTYLIKLISKYEQQQKELIGALRFCVIRECNNCHEDCDRCMYNIFKQLLQKHGVKL